MQLMTLNGRPRRVAVTGSRLCGVLGLVHLVELKPLGAMDERQQLWRGVLGILFDEQQVHVVEVCGPFIPEVRCCVVPAADGSHDLLDQRRNSILDVDALIVRRFHAQDLLAGHDELGRHQRRTLDDGDTGGVNQAEFAHVVASRRISISHQDFGSRVRCA